jgi:2-polyprenyl-3-methyl-5-hydroxy-6-metoxy-1,4-benzoquinol methylase
VPAALDRRDRTPELMDDPGLDPAEHRAALAGLARLNRFSQAAGALWPAIRTLAREHPGERVRVLDVATGGGDVPIRLWTKARRGGFDNLVLHGCDLSPTALRVAGEGAVRAGAAVGFFSHDVIRDPLPGGYDVVTCSLFLHHLSDDDAVAVLRRMKDAAGRLVLVNDLARSRFNYLAVWLACRVLTRSRVVRFDGPASVRSAFTPPEALGLAERAGLTGATVARRFPCRFLLNWSRP